LLIVLDLGECRSGQRLHLCRCKHVHDVVARQLLVFRAFEYAFEGERLRFPEIRTRIAMNDDSVLRIGVAGKFAGIAKQARQGRRVVESARARKLNCPNERYASDRGSLNLVGRENFSVLHRAVVAQHDKFGTAARQQADFRQPHRAADFEAACKANQRLTADGPGPGGQFVNAGALDQPDDGGCRSQGRHDDVIALCDIAERSGVAVSYDGIEIDDATPPPRSRITFRRLPVLRIPPESKIASRGVFRPLIVRRPGA
jgi:hypothetical protein